MSTKQDARADFNDKSISESFVKESVYKYLVRESFPIIFKEFASDDMRLDFLAYKWADDGYGIKYFVIECKDSYDLRVKGFTEIVQGQVSQYQKAFPQIYLAIPRPKDADKKFYTTLCEFHNVGLLLVGNNSDIEERIDPSKPAKEEIYASTADFSSVAAAFLAFTYVFRNQPINGPFPRWISTKGDVQYNLWHDEDSLRFGVNVEDASKVKTSISSDVLRKLSSESGVDAEIYVRKEKYLTPRRRQWDMALKKPFRKLHENLDDINYIIKLIDGANKSDYKTHLNISVPLWDIGFLPGKSEAEQTIDSARNFLKSAFETFS